jgi:hypothetical protein
MKAFQIEIKSLYAITSPNQAVIQWLWVGMTTSVCARSRNQHQCSLLNHID